VGTDDTEAKAKTQQYDISFHFCMMTLQYDISFHFKWGFAYIILLIVLEGGGMKW
jgi:hypothetical protein